MRSSTSQFGFSLIEVVVTVAVLMVAASVAVMNMGSAVHSSHIETIPDHDRSVALCTTNGD